MRQGGKWFSVPVILGCAGRNWAQGLGPPAVLPRLLPDLLVWEGTSVGAGRGSVPPWGTRALVLRARSSLHPLFSSQGFDEDLQQEGTLLGQFTYDQDGEPIQTFYFQVWDAAMLTEVTFTFPSTQRFLNTYPGPGTGGSGQEKV